MSQVEYRPDYSYANALKDTNPFKQFVEPFEKITSSRIAANKAELDTEKTNSVIANLDSKTRGQEATNAQVPLKSAAEIGLLKAREEFELSKTRGQNTENSIKPKVATAEIASKNADATKKREETKYIGKEFVLKSKKVINDIDNNNAITGQKAYKNALDTSLVQAQISKINTDTKTNPKTLSTIFK